MFRTVIVGIPVTVMGVMPRLRAGRLRNSWFSSRQLQETSVLFKAFRLALEPTSLLDNGYWEHFTLG